MPAYTVIVATYQRPALLAEALASIQAQTVTDFECLVVEDGSDTAGSVLPADPRFSLIEIAENQGVAHAWNVGVARAAGDAVAFLDDDDVWLPRRLEFAAAGLTRADVAVCGSRWMHETTATATPVLEGEVHDTILEHFTPNMGRTAVRRSAKLPFDERYRGSQDIEWWIRQSAVSRVATEPDLGLLSRAHDGPRTTNGTDERIASGLRMLEEHGDYFAAHTRARAFRQYRIGVMLDQIDRHDEARTWYRKSIRSRPSRRAVASLVRLRRSGVPPE